jgi:hypothetical protein
VQCAEFNGCVGGVCVPIWLDIDYFCPMPGYPGVGGCYVCNWCMEAAWEFNPDACAPSGCFFANAVGGITTATAPTSCQPESVDSPSCP